MPPVTTVDGAELERVMLLGAVTVVAALAQLVVLQLDPGVAGDVLPVGSTAA